MTLIEPRCCALEEFDWRRLRPLAMSSPHLCDRAHCQDIAGGGVQHGILGRAEDEGESMLLAVAEHDEIHAVFACESHDFRLDGAHLDTTTCLRQLEIGGEACQAL